MKLKRRTKYYLLRLFRLNASPHKVAIGLMLGFMPSWFPTLGLGPILSIGLAKMIRGNLIAAIIGGAMGTLIWPVLFLINYKIGSMVILHSNRVEDMSGIQYPTVNNGHSGSIIFLTGTIINVLITSILIYLAVYMLFMKYRVRILLKLKQW